MKKLAFSNKAHTLIELKEHLTTAKVLDILAISYYEFKTNNIFTIQKIQKHFDCESLIIRSSSSDEDSFNTSNAGKFTSISNVDKQNESEVLDALNEVFNSYSNLSDNQELFVQPMLKNIKRAGVILTADMDTLSPYYIINYDESSSNDSVTSGSSSNLKTYISFKEYKFKSKDTFINRVIETCKECENLFDYKYLDIEFAFNTNEELFIFQVRPIITSNKENYSSLDLASSLEKVEKKIEKLNNPHIGILGNKTIFGIMPDWNPAEIIGIKPKTLAISLYKELITDSIWAFQRNNYGYRNLRSFPLLVSFLGAPFIDVRVSFNSFIPSTLNEIIANKLCNYYLNKLESYPKLHDKVEFEIVYSCYYINLSSKLKDLLDYGFNENEIKRIEFCLLELTNNILSKKDSFYYKDLEKVELLKDKYDEIESSSLSTIDKIYWHIENCKRYGTLPFAGIARAAFISVQFLKSFLESGIITDIEYSNFLNSLNTVSKQLSNATKKLKDNKISRDDFLKEYGHLRPGTYDIMSFRYDEAFEDYFHLSNNDMEDNVISEEANFSFIKETLSKIDSLLIENGIKTDANSLITFIKSSIENREYSKFVFTKSLSRVLQLLEEFGKRFEVSREELSYLDIHEILKMYSTLDHRDVFEILKTNIEKNKDFYKFTKAIKLPPLIISPEDIYNFFQEEGEPNFITLKRIKEDTILEVNLNKETPKNKIVFIESADPGYDFLFTKEIGGLVTKYGGANSHMAIRCAELGIPAIIGAGEKNFDNWKKYKFIEIDCLNKKVYLF
jgi:phosphohistidine swiveling domain-containing protein